ncbi:MAG: hypothetical protein ACLURV_07100 [Gallintestinimicrobium sp.]
MSESCGDAFIRERDESIILTVTVLPVLGGALIPLLPFRSRRQMLIYIETVVLINTALVLTALLNRPWMALFCFI